MSLWIVCSYCASFKLHFCTLDFFKIKRLIKFDVHVYFDAIIIYKYLKMSYIIKRVTLDIGSVFHHSANAISRCYERELRLWDVLLFNISKYMLHMINEITY